MRYRRLPGIGAALAPVLLILVHNWLSLSGQKRFPDVPGNVRICPDGGCRASAPVSIVAGQSIQAAVDAAPPGTSFLLKAGVHRLQRVTAKDGNTFLGETGTVLSGARLLTNFVQQGSVWVADGQTQAARTHGECLPAYPRCDRPEELFVDDVRMRHVGDLSAVGPGTWFFDYAAKRIYLGTNPAAHRVETSVTDAAFTGRASRVTITRLTIEKYASPAQSGAIDGASGRGWIVAANVIRLNHGAGLSLGPSMQVRDNHILANGQLGIGGGDGYADIQVEGNEIASNNQAGFDPLWEAGGTKFWATTNLVVRGNTVHHNLGPGLWTDTDNRGTLYENNIVEDNRGAGIFHEVSYAAVIRNNSLRRNGEDSGVWSGGAGILISASSDVEVYGNLVEDNANAIVGMQQDRGSGRFGPYLVRNLYVHDNTLRLAVGLNGIIEDVGNSAPFTSRNNRWQSNTYYLGTNRSYFAWLGIRTETEWQNYGNDTTGMFLR